MQRKAFIAVLTIALLAIIAIPAWAAYSDAQAEALKELYEERLAVELSILDKQVEMELLTEEAADLARERLILGYENRSEAIDSREYTSRGKGSMMQGFRGGDGGRGWMDGWNCHNGNTTPRAEETSQTF